MVYYLNSVEHKNGKVIVKVRQWDGIDRPDYLTLGELSPENALSWANDIAKEADAAYSYLEAKRIEDLAEKRARLQDLQRQVSELEAELCLPGLPGPGDAEDGRMVGVIK